MCVDNVEWSTWDQMCMKWPSNYHAVMRALPTSFSLLSCLLFHSPSLLVVAQPLPQTAATPSALHGSPWTEWWVVPPHHAQWWRKQSVRPDVEKAARRQLFGRLAASDANHQLDDRKTDEKKVRCNILVCKGSNWWIVFVYSLWVLIHLQFNCWTETVHTIKAFFPPLKRKIPYFKL